MNDSLTFGSHRFALRFRDWAVKTIRRETRKLHPPDAYGTVTDVDYTARTATCVFGLSTVGVSRSFSATVQPSVGDTVRVCGRATNRYIAAIITPPIWQDPASFSGAWAAGTPAPQFFRDTFGFVHLRGQLVSGVGGTTAFTLPTECRPSQTTTGPAAVTVATDGTVKPTSSGTTWLSGTIFDVN